MRPKIIVCIVLVCCLFGSLPYTAQNPFVSGKKDAEQPESPGRKYPRFLQPILAKITAWQRVIRQELTRFGKEIREHPYSVSFWLFLLFSFVYGVIHALGPGHGKSIVVSYFLSRPGKYLHGILMGNMLTIVHVSSAVVIVLLIRLVLDTTGVTSFEAASRNLENISYGLLIVLGLFLLAKGIYELQRGKYKSLGDRPSGNFELKHLALMAFVTGLVPCPGAALILIYTITQQILFAGLMAMVCVAAGMGATTSLFALVAIASRNTLFRLTARRQKLFIISHAVLSISGALVIITIGTLLLLG